MSRSMTAFARLETTGTFGRAVWELRSVNHRYLEIGLRLPEDLRALENDVRTRIAARLNRGKVDCALRLESSVASGSHLQVNRAVVQQVVGAALVIAELLPQVATINPLEVLRWPGVLSAPEIDFDTLAGALLE
ncbi:MAG: YicC/YloC family endoribonuclease, partial [Gammaproteobacteria bacterium]